MRQPFFLFLLRYLSPNMKKVIAVCVVSSLLLSGELLAQGNRLNSLWFDLNPRYAFNNKLEMRGDLSYRINPEENFQAIIIRPVLAWFPSSIFSFRFGVGYFYTDNDNTFNDIELRGHQAVNIRWPQIVGVEFAHRFQVEERFIYDDSNELFDFVSRGRYRLRVASPDFGFFGLKRKFYGLTSLEFLFNFNNTNVLAIEYQDRLTFGLGYRWTTKFRTEFHYQSHGARFNFSDGFKVNENIWRLRVFYRINELE